MGIKVTRSWLESIISTTLSNNEIGETLTRAGLELDSLEQLRAGFSGVVTGRLAAVTEHSNADKLSVCSVDVGAAEMLSIVCGCSTVRVGMYVAVAKHGAILPGNFKIKKTKLRGEVSEGMLCSESELALPTTCSGILDLPECDLGIDLAAELGLEDTLFDFDVTPNRGDCLSLYGVARELVAFQGASFKVQEAMSLGSATVKSVAAVVQDKDACPVYNAYYISGLDATKKLPLKYRVYLDKISISSVNPLVDLANYLMFEQGQPFHIFDADKINGGLVVRYAVVGERIILLNGDDILLHKDTLVIADDDKVVAIAGIMGANNAAVDYGTKNIIVESAFFQPNVIAKTCRRYNLNSDAAYRFERGVDPARATELGNCLVAYILDIFSASFVASTTFSCLDELCANYRVSLEKSDITKLLGFRIDDDKVEDYLIKIGANFVATESSWSIVSPSYRFDLRLSVDYIEEILRYNGYDNIPEGSMLFEGAAMPAPSEVVLFATFIRNTMIVKGFFEVVSYSFISEIEYNDFSLSCAEMTLTNPISQNMSVMRASLLPGLVRSFSYNSKRQKNNIRLFEIGQCFNASGQSELNFAALLSGDRYVDSWDKKSDIVDFYDIKSIAQSLLSHLTLEIDFHCCNTDGFHPGQSASIIVMGQQCGVLGKIHPRVAARLGLEQNIFLLEMNLDLLDYKSKLQFSSYSRQPKVRRDLCLEVPDIVNYSDILTVISELNIDLLQDINLFDVYTIKNENSAKKDKKSLAIKLIFQHDTKTLFDEEVDKMIQRVIDALVTLNIHVR